MRFLRLQNKVMFCKRKVERYRGVGNRDKRREHDLGVVNPHKHVKAVGEGGGGGAGSGGNKEH